MHEKPKNREWVKNAAIIFLAVLLVLTFFSNTIMNRSLPEVATQEVTDGTIVARVRGTGTVTANTNSQVKMDKTRVIRSVLVKVGQEVKAGDVLFTLGEGSSEEIDAAEDTLRSLQASYDRTAVTMPVHDYTTDYRKLDLLQQRMEEAKEALDSAERAAKDATPFQEQVAAIEKELQKATVARDKAKKEYDTERGIAEDSTPKKVKTVDDYVGLFIRNGVNSDARFLDLKNELSKKELQDSLQNLENYQEALIRILAMRDELQGDILSDSSMTNRSKIETQKSRLDYMSYTVSFYNSDNEDKPTTLLQSTQETYGSWPSYTGPTPTRGSDEVFAGWDPEIAIVTKDAKYVAQYAPIKSTDPEKSSTDDNEQKENEDEKSVEDALTDVADALQDIADALNGSEETNPEPVLPASEETTTESPEEDPTVPDYPSVQEEPAVPEIPTPEEDPVLTEETVLFEEPALEEETPPAEDPTPVEDPAPVENLPPVEDPAPVEDPTPVENLPPVEDPAPVEDPTPVENLPPVEDPAPVEDPTLVEDPVPVQDPAPVEDSAPAEEPPVLSAAAEPEDLTEEPQANAAVDDVLTEVFEEDSGIREDSDAEGAEDVPKSPKTAGGPPDPEIWKDDINKALELYDEAESYRYLKEQLVNQKKAAYDAAAAEAEKWATALQTMLESGSAESAVYKTRLEQYRNARDDYETALETLNEKMESDRRTDAGYGVDLADIRKQIDKAKQKLADLTGDEEAQILAKVAGTVQSIECSPGDTKQKDDILATIEMPDMGYSLSFSVTNDQANRLRPGDTATVSNFYWGTEIVATLESIKVDPKNPQTNKQLNFNLTGNVTAGSELTISVGQKSANYDIIIPSSSIRSDSNGSFVLKVEAKNSPLGNRYIARRVPVEVLASDDSNSAVTADLGFGDYVITTSSAPIKNGDLVRLATA